MTSYPTRREVHGPPRIVCASRHPPRPLGGTKNQRLIGFGRQEKGKAEEDKDRMGNRERENTRQYNAYRVGSSSIRFMQDVLSLWCLLY